MAKKFTPRKRVRRKTPKIVIDYSRMTGKSHPALEPPRGDPLPDSACNFEWSKPGDRALSERYRMKRAKQLLAKKKKEK